MSFRDTLNKLKMTADELLGPGRPQQGYGPPYQQQPMYGQPYQPYAPGPGYHPAQAQWDQSHAAQWQEYTDHGPAWQQQRPPHLEPQPPPQPLSQPLPGQALHSPPFPNQQQPLSGHQQPFSPPLPGHQQSASPPLHGHQQPASPPLHGHQLPLSAPLQGPHQHPLTPPLPAPGQHPLSSPHQGPSQALASPQAISPPLPGQGPHQGPQPEAQAKYNSHPSSDPMPPPIPFHSKPPSRATSFNYTNPSMYWKPHFTPDIPVSHEFEHKQGHGDPWGWGNNELQNYTSDIGNSFYTPDGKLVLKAISAPDHPNEEARFTSARLVSRATLGKRDGCLTAWLTLPCAEGIWPAFWLLPREPFVWPHEGEVDIAESWNGDCENHSCLHWGFYNAEDAHKHLVRGTHISDMPTRIIRFDFVWQCSRTGVQADGKSAGGGRLMWYIDERPVMKNLMPPGTRPIEDWTILLNIAMGGNVCQGKQPREGSYDMIVHGLQMSEMPDSGWGRFDADWQHCVDGAIM